MAGNAATIGHRHQRADGSMLRQIGLSVFCLACGLLVFTVFNHYHPLLGERADRIGRVAASVLFIAVAIAARQSERWRGYWRMLFAFGTACAAISLDYLLGLSRWILPALALHPDSPAGMAIDKLESSALSVAVILLLTLVSGQSLRSLRLKRGRLGLGLGVGAIVLAVVLATAIPQAEYLFGGKDLSWQRILPWTPWIAIFVLANAFNEELLFRGLLLGRMESFMPRAVANVLTTIPFTLMHTGVDYSSDIWLFVAILLPLSLAWGWLMQKTDSIWGSVLFHAAMDIPIVLGLLSSTGGW